MGRRRQRQYKDLSRPQRERGFEVEALEVGVRLDVLLPRRLPWRTRSQFVRMLKAGDVHLNGRPAKPAARVRAGDKVVVTLPEEPDAPLAETADDLVFLHEDEHLLAVDKPSGMAVHPAGRIRYGTLINKLHARYRDPDPSRDIVPRLAHRLDLDTSGVVLAVLNRRVDALVTEQFTKREVRKTYLALVHGVPSLSEGVIEAPIGQALDADTQVHMGVRPDGQGARSSYLVREAFARHALMELRLHTGRTHQLRVHMAHIGHPIVCDHLYGDCRPVLASSAQPELAPTHDMEVLERLGLHAHRLEMIHPVTGSNLTLTSPLPPEMERCLAALRHLEARTWRGSSTWEQLGGRVPPASCVA